MDWGQIDAFMKERMADTKAIKPWMWTCHHVKDALYFFG